MFEATKQVLCIKDSPQNAFDSIAFICITIITQGVEASQEASTFRGLEASCLEIMFSNTLT
jgi:hypothetical protein